MRRAFLAACLVVIAACAVERDVETEGAYAIETPITSTPMADSVPPDSVPTPPPPRTTEAHPEHSEPGEGEPDDSLVVDADTGDGLGDELFPDLGNPGVDVENYHLKLRYNIADDTIEASVVLTIVPTQDRGEFTLDAVGLDVSAVAVDGAAAAFAVEEVELRVTPADPLLAGKRVDVEVVYSAAPDAGTSAAGLPNGWFHTDSGSYVLNEPDGARTWLPSNDHPADKATWTFEITVPDGLVAVANGELVSEVARADGVTWTWRETRPMATYLIQLLTGYYELVEDEGPGGLPLLSVVLRGDRDVMQPYLDTIDDQIDYFDDFFGPYPLDRYGIAMTESFSGLAMETQSRSMFSREDFASGELGYVQELLLSHELTHMWFGNAVTFGEWQDIWLAEAFATYGQWMWLDEVGQASFDDLAAAALAEKMSASNSTAEPPVEELFGANSYDGGAVILHALRLSIGDDKFFTLLRQWISDNNGESRVTDDFTRLASEVAACDLQTLFDEWLFARVPPETYPERIPGCH